MIDLMTIPSWLNEHFRAWEKETGRKQTVSAFARWLGIKQPTLNRWMNGDNEPDGENLRILARKLGPEVYEIVGQPAPDDLFSHPDIPPEFRALLIAATRELADTLAENRIDPASPEGEALAVSVMARHGYKRIDTTSPGKSG
jgi:transcriptional regulator with XRE-family HTH domain